MNNNLESKLLVNDDAFTLDIREWTPTTLAIFKTFSDWKCNGGKTTEIVEKKVETESNTQTEEEQKNPNITEPKKLTICQYKVKAEEILDTDGNMKIYKQIEEYLEKNLSDEFTREDMIVLVVKAWKDVFNEELSMGSAKTYWIKYKRYMEKQGLIKEDKPYSYHKIKEDKEWVEDDDPDDEKDHCYLPEWTNDELDVLEKNIFSFPTKKESVEHIAKELGKSESEVILKAKKRGMIFR